MIRSLNGLALNNLKQHRLRTLLSAAAVIPGVAMVIAADVIGGAIRSAVEEGGEAQSFASTMGQMIDVMLASVGIVILAAAAFLIFNAFSMSVTQRQQQIGALRALGMTRAQVMRLIFTEALLIGALGTLPGLLLGPLLGQAVIALMQQLGGEQFLIFGEVALLPVTFAKAALLGMGVTLLAVMLPARTAAGVAPLAALRPEAAAGMETTARRPLVLSLSVIVLMALWLAAAPPGEWVQRPLDGLLMGLFALVWLACLAVLLPGLVGGLGRVARALLGQRGATGRLVADNLRRGRRRVTLTVVTLAVALGMIVALTGVMTFYFKGMLLRTLDNASAAGLYMIAPFDPAQGLAGFATLDMTKLVIPSEAVADIQEAMSGRAEIAQIFISFPPELSVLVPGMFSYVMGAQELRLAGNPVFEFTEGDWARAMPILEAGCGLLLSPGTARGQDVAVGDPLTITGPSGPLECIVAGIGASPMGVSIVSGDVLAAFDLETPMYIMLIPRPGADPELLEADMAAVLARHEGIYPIAVDFVIEFQSQITDILIISLNAILLLAVAAAALGVVNTTMMSVAERKQELGLLRAVGCTGRQVRNIVAGEAALMGLAGGLLGLAAGVGLTIIIVVVGGVNAYGLVDYALWPEAGKAVAPALLNGLVGLLAAPFIAAAAAWLPARTLLRGSPVEVLAQST